MLMKENILCLPSLVKVGVGVKEFLLAHLACFASTSQLPETSRGTSAKRNTIFFKCLHSSNHNKNTNLGFVKV